MKNSVPSALRNAFIFHFYADIIFAIPLFFFPEAFLALLSWKTIDPISTRIVASALFAIGIKSYLERNASIDVYKSMITLKIIWSFFASAGLLYGIFAGEFGDITIGWLFFGTFFAFHLLWWYWKLQLTSADTAS